MFKNNLNQIYAYLLLTPALILMGTFTHIPSIKTLISSFFSTGTKKFPSEFLGFENGPSETITLQWATFYDAAIETCLSRIWGGIHPPADDIEGRKVGKKVAENAIDFSEKFLK